MSIPELAFAGLEEALNQYVDMDPKTATELAKLHGRAIALDIAGPEIRMFLIPGPGRLQVMRLYEGEPECVLRGSPMALARLSVAKEEAVEQLFSGQIEITGDVELGRRFGEILGALNIDWEEHLAVHMGDFIAHDVVSGVRFIADRGCRTVDSIGKSLAQFVQGEGKLLPERPEVQAFASKIDTLRDDFDRLQARIDRLRNQATSNNTEN